MASDYWEVAKSLSKCKNVPKKRNLKNRAGVYVWIPHPAARPPPSFLFASR